MPQRPPLPISYLSVRGLYSNPWMIRPSQSPHALMASTRSAVSLPRRSLKGPPSSCCAALRSCWVWCGGGLNRLDLNFFGGFQNSTPRSKDFVPCVAGPPSICNDTHTHTLCTWLLLLAPVGVAPALPSPNAVCPPPAGPWPPVAPSTLIA